MQQSSHSGPDDITESQEPVLTHLIRCVDPARNAVFIPSQNMLVIHEQGLRRKVELGFSASRILDILIDHSGQIVNRDQIFAYAWPDRVVGSNSLNQAISTMRELLGDEEHRTIIQTVPRRGYQFNPEFLSPPEQLAELLDQPERSPNSPRVPFPDLSRVGRIKYLKEAMLVTLVVALGFSLVWRVDWNLWSQAGLLKDVYTDGDLSVVYTAPHREELEQLQLETTGIRDRMVKLVAQPTTVVFNMMHGFYDIVCIERGTVEFISVHKGRLDALTDEQLLGCLK